MQAPSSRGVRSPPRPGASPMLRFLTTLLGPILARDMVEIARRRRYYVSRFFYGLALLAVLLVVAEQYRQHIQSGGLTSIRVRATAGESLFRTVIWLQY